INSNAGNNFLVKQQLVIERAAVSLIVIMWTTTARQKAETIKRDQHVGKRICHALLEPTNGAGATTGEYDAGLPSFAYNLRQPPFTPHRQHAAGIAAADVNHILAQQQRAQVSRRATEEPQVR